MLGNVSISACRFYENSCYLRNEAYINAAGGAVYLNGAGDASVSDCHFARNYAYASYTMGIGGGLYAQNARVEGCLFEDCVGEDAGGAVYQSGGSLKTATSPPAIPRQEEACTPSVCLTRTTTYSMPLPQRM